jgi:hypothetical protein
MKKEDFPGDCDALARLCQSLEGVECGVTEKEKEEIFKKLKERKEKKKRKSKGTAEPAPATMEGVLSQPAAPAVVHLPLPPPSKRMRTGAADSASSSSSNSTGISFFAPPAASPSLPPPISAGDEPMEPSLSLFGVNTSTSIMKRAKFAQLKSNVEKYLDSDEKLVGICFFLIFQKISDHLFFRKCHASMGQYLSR